MFSIALQSSPVRLRVAVQGLGKVGIALCGLMHEAGARLVVSDVDQARVEAAVNAFEATPSPVDTIHEADVDVFAPCAFGAGLSDKTIPNIRASMVAGAAKNQLHAPIYGAALKDRNILYAPDYIINDGALIQLAVERGRQQQGEYETARAADLDMLDTIYHLASAEDIATNIAADRLAERRLRNGLPSAGELTHAR